MRGAAQPPVLQSNNIPLKLPAKRLHTRVPELLHQYTITRVIITYGGSYVMLASLKLPVSEDLHEQASEVQMETTCFKALILCRSSSALHLVDIFWCTNLG